jgi:release factor glutamine methyltransferase
MTIQEALDHTVSQFEQARIPDARLDAEYLVAEAVGVPRLRLMFRGGMLVQTDQQRRLDQWVRERLERKPLAYVLGEQPFMNLLLRVSPCVLIPRPETELLVEEALRLLDGIPAATVVDVGTGSGNIALSLARHPHTATVHAVDISLAALAIARENALRNFIRKPIEWHQGNLLAPLIERRLAADLVVANLPYVRTHEIPTLSPEVRWEPALALDGGRDGLAYISELIEQAETVLKPEGVLLLEIGADQGEAVLERLQSRKSWFGVRLTEDLAGLPRIIEARKGVLIGSLNH